MVFLHLEVSPQRAVDLKLHTPSQEPLTPLPVLGTYSTWLKLRLCLEVSLATEHSYTIYFLAEKKKKKLHIIEEVIKKII